MSKSGLIECRMKEIFHALPPTGPALAPAVYVELNRQAELALVRLAGVSGLVPSVLAELPRPPVIFVPPSNTPGSSID